MNLNVNFKMVMIFLASMTFFAQTSMADEAMKKPLGMPSQNRPANPCQDDIKKFCSSTGSVNIKECLEKNESVISTECKTMVSKMKEHINKLYDVCKNDIVKLCPEIKIESKDPAAGACLFKQVDTLSAECKSLLKPIPVKK